MSKKRLISLLTLVIILSCFKNSQGLKRAEVPMLVNQFLAMHVRYHELDDELSARILDNFILSLDYGKYYFYKKDIEKFAVHRAKIDDYIRSNKLDFMDEIYTVYRQRYIESNRMVGELLKSTFDFTVDEKMVVDRDRVDFAETKEELRERWRKSIKLQLLNYISADQSIAEAKKKLAKKYELMNKRVEEINEEKLIDRFMNAFSTALDPHSNYLTQDENEDFSISMKLKLEGIGVRLKSEDGFVIVESIIVGGAADKLPEKIKLKTGDKIIAVSQSDGDAFDVIDMDLRDVVKKIRGPKGTEVRLTVLRKAGEANKATRMIVPIMREEISLKDSDAESEIFHLDKEKKVKVGFIKLPSFYYDRERGKSSSGDVRDILGRLKMEGVSCIVLDLRGNPGGLLNEAVDIAGFFIEGGPVLQIVDGRNSPHVVSDNDENIVYSGPIVVLIDRFSASAAEILAGAIKDYNRGLIIGPDSTFGKGTVQTYNELPQKKGAVKITISIFYQPSGTSNQLTGIAPDIRVPDMTSIWDIGESKSRYPLAWKKIEPAPHKDYAMVNQGLVTQLTGLSTARINGNEKYRKLVEKIRNYREQVNSKSISLKEESSIEKQKQKEMEKTLNKDSDRKLIDLENDLFLGEAFRITGDYINRLGK